MEITKIRIGKAMLIDTREDVYNLEFKLDDDKRFYGYSYDHFQTKKDAQLALNNHNSGCLVYKPFRKISNSRRWWLKAEVPADALPFFI